MTLIVFFFCSHHNNTLQVIIKLEIFFVFLTKKPFFVSAPIMSGNFFHILQKIFLSYLHAPPPDKEGLWHSMTGRDFFLFFYFFADNSAFDFSLKKNLLTLLKSDRTIFNLNRGMLTPLIKTDS